MSNRYRRNKSKREDPTLGEIPPLNINKDLHSNTFIVLLGRRGAGKSFLGRRLMKRFRKIPTVKVVCPTEKLNHEFSKHVPDICIDDTYDTDELQRILLRQEEIRDLKETDPRYAKIDPRTMYIADDIMYMKKNPLKDEPFRELVYNGRHYNITSLYMAQYPLGVPKEMRGCIDYVFILAEDSEMIRELIYENYGKGVFSNKYLFYQAMDLCTVDRGCLVLKLTKTSNDDQDTSIKKTDIERMRGKVFFYRADAPGEFKCGSDEFWKTAMENTDKNYRRKAREAKWAALQTKGIRVPKKMQSGFTLQKGSEDIEDDGENSDRNFEPLSFIFNREKMKTSSERSERRKESYRKKEERYKKNPLNSKDFVESNRHRSERRSNRHRNERSRRRSRDSSSDSIKRSHQDHNKIRLVRSSKSERGSRSERSRRKSRMEEKYASSERRTRSPRVHLGSYTIRKTEMEKRYDSYVDRKQGRSKRKNKYESDSEDDLFSNFKVSF